MNAIIFLRKILTVAAFLVQFSIPQAQAENTTLLEMTGTGNTFGGFGLYDGLTFTADGVGNISSFNYTGMSYSEGFVAQLDLSNKLFQGLRQGPIRVRLRG